MRAWVRRALDVAVVAALLGTAAFAVLAWKDASGHAVLTDLDGRAVVLDEVLDPAADPSATGGRFQAPGQGLDVPLLTMSVSGGVLNPPTFTDAYLVRDPDRATADGVRPLVVAVHAVRDGRAPGNAFFEPRSADPALTVGPGDELLVDGVRYVVGATEVLSKADAARSPRIWGPDPEGDRRLVVVTCLQRSGSAGQASENLVVHAVRA